MQEKWQSERPRWRALCWHLNFTVEAETQISGSETKMSVATLKIRNNILCPRHLKHLDVQA
jgi:hypothetical protein